MKTDDADLKKSDPDLSMNYKNIGGSTLADIALRVFLAQESPEKPKEVKSQRELMLEKLEKMKGFPKSGPKSEEPKEKQTKKPEIVFPKDIDKFNKILRDDFVKYAKENNLSQSKINSEVNENSDKVVKDTETKLVSAKDAEEIYGIIKSIWPLGGGNWGKKSAILRAVDGAKNKFSNLKGLPEYLSLVLESKPTEEIEERKFLKKILDGMGKKSLSRIDNRTATKHAALVVIHDILEKMPHEPSFNKIATAINDAVDRTYKELTKLKEIEIFMDVWEKSVEQLGEIKPGEKWTFAKGYDSALRGIENMIESKNKPYSFELNELMDEFESSMKNKYDNIPSELSAIFKGFKRAASNKQCTHKYMNKTATFHGHIQQGHPSGPTNTGWKSLDKRYLTSDNYKSILSFAKDLLKENWFKNGWGSGSPDAPIRAALDVAIHLADDNLYQNKIDVETYNMLLNRLSGDDIDLFTETMHSNKSKKASMTKRESIGNILRLASDLQHSNPAESIKLIQSLRSIMAQSDSMRIAQDNPELDTKELEKRQQELKKALDNEDIEAFVEAFQEMGKTIKKISSRLASVTDKASDPMKTDMEAVPPMPMTVEGGGGAQTSQTMTGGLEILETKSLADLSVDELKEVFTDAKKISDEFDKALKDLDVDAFVEAFQEMGDMIKKKTASMYADLFVQQINDALIALRAENHWASSKHLDTIEIIVNKMASNTYVNANVLARVASKNEHVKTALLPLLFVASKKKPKKTSKKVKKDKPVPPVKKEKEVEKKPEKSKPKIKPPKVKKASITKDDMNW